jgi:hypothetical protein
VALDFNWPLNKVWKGFINPHYKECPESNKTCFGGSTAAGAWLSSISRFLALLGEQAIENKPGHAEACAKRGCIYPHPYLAEFPQAPTTSVPSAVIQAAFDKFPDDFRSRVHHTQTHAPTRLVVPDAGVEKLIRGLAKYDGPVGIFAHDMNYDLYKRLAKMSGMPKGWDSCPVCKGKNIDPASNTAYEAWEEEPPPEGPGYQLWETVSEGSPVSPVFPTKEAFIGHLTRVMGHSREAAENFCDDGSAPSMVMAGGKLYEGIDSCAIPNSNETTK